MPEPARSTEPARAPQDAGHLANDRDDARRDDGRAGDAAIRRMAAGGAAATTFVSWSKSQKMAIQTQLKRLGLYRLGIDGDIGQGSMAGLVEAFGGDEWRSMTAEKVLERLRAAQAPTGKKGEHALRYGEMFKDGVLDMTLGIGYDEGGVHEWTVQAMTDVLAAHGFKVDAAAAARIYAQAGRPLAKGSFGSFYVRQNALTYKPPAGEARQVHAVIRLIDSGDGSKGEQAAGAFKDGMKQSDIAYYAGHARYGSGPDFDRNMSFELQDERGNWRQIDDYEVLKEELEREGRPKGRDAWAQFLHRNGNGTLKVIGSNKGNVFLNKDNQHPGEFGGKLMFWNLNRKEGGATAVTGKDGEMAKRDAERKYHLWVFDGCRTQDYVKSIRNTPEQDSKKTDVISTGRITYWNDKARVLASFLDSVLGQQSAEQVVKGMEKENTTGDEKGQAMKGDGFEDNPIIP